MADNKPVWNTAGQPENLEAAAFDALEWLELFKLTSFIIARPFLSARLAACIAQLRHKLRVPLEQAGKLPDVVTEGGDNGGA